MKSVCGDAVCAALHINRQKLKQRDKKRRNRNFNSGRGCTLM